MGDSYSSWVDHIQPPLAMMAIVSLALVAFPALRWMPATLLLFLTAAQTSMTYRMVRRLRQWRYLAYAPMSFVRAFWRGVGMTHGVLRYLASRIPQTPESST